MTSNIFQKCYFKLIAQWIVCPSSSSLLPDYPVLTMNPTLLMTPSSWRLYHPSVLTLGNHFLNPSTEMTFVCIDFSGLSPGPADERSVSWSPGSACLSFTRGRLTRTKWQNLLMAVWPVCVSPPICQTENKNIQSRKCRNELTQSEVGNVLNIQLTALTELTSTAAEDVYSGKSFFFHFLLSLQGLGQVSNSDKQEMFHQITFLSLHQNEMV